MLFLIHVPKFPWICAVPQPNINRTSVTNKWIANAFCRLFVFHFPCMCCARCSFAWCRFVRYSRTHTHTHLMIHLFFRTSVSPAEGTREIKCVRQRYTCAIISVREQCDQYLFDSKRFYYHRAVSFSSLFTRSNNSHNNNNNSNRHWSDDEAIFTI